MDHNQDSYMVLIHRIHLNLYQTLKSYWSGFESLVVGPRCRYLLQPLNRAEEREENEFEEDIPLQGQYPLPMKSWGRKDEDELLNQLNRGLEREKMTTGTIELTSADLVMHTSSGQINKSGTIQRERRCSLKPQLNPSSDVAMKIDSRYETVHE